MNENMVYAAFFFPAAAAVLVFSMKYVAAIMQARVRVGQDDAYRAIAADCRSAQIETAAALASLRAAIAEIHAQLAAVTQILQQVE